MFKSCAIICNCRLQQADYDACHELKGLRVEYDCSKNTASARGSPTNDEERTSGPTLIYIKRAARRP